HRFTDMRRFGLATQSRGDLGTIGRFLRLLLCLAQTSGRTWLSCVIGMQLAGPCCGSADPEGLAPFPDGLGADVPLVFDGLLRLPPDRIGKIAVHADGTLAGSLGGFPHWPGDR